MIRLLKSLLNQSSGVTHVPKLSTTWRQGKHGFYLSLSNLHICKNIVVLFVNVFWSLNICLIVLYRYKLHIHVMDQTAEIKLLLFELNATKLIGTTAEELVDGRYEEVCFQTCKYF